MHWGDNAGWQICLALSTVIEDEVKKLVAASPFISLSLDEATGDDKSSLMCAHVYTVEDFVRRVFFLEVSSVD